MARLFSWLMGLLAVSALAYGADADAPACDAAAAANPPKACGPTLSKLPFPKDLNRSIAIVRSCSEKVQNCASELVGPGAVQVVHDAGKLAIAVGRDDAKAISASATSQKPDEIQLQYNKRLSRIATVLAFQGMLDNMVEEYAGLTDLMAQGKDPGWERFYEIAEIGALQSIWTAITNALEACGEAAALLAPGAPGAKKTPASDKQKDEIAERMREGLVCSMRLGADLRHYPALKVWPGCPCDGGKGRLLEGVCVTTDSLVRFGEFPIDARVPARLGAMIRGLKARLPEGATIQEINLVGCTFERMERGGKMKTLAGAAKPLVDEHDISDHARGTACDLDAVTVKLPGEAKPRVFSMASKGATPYADALAQVAALAKLPKPHRTEKDKGNPVFEPPIGEYYRGLETFVKDDKNKPKGMSAESWFQLKMGVFTRESLVDSGFTVFDPLVNGAHADHFHFEVPFEAYIADEVGTDKTSPGDKDDAIEYYLRRAAFADARKSR